jgi:hypothetical protein
MDIPIHHTEIYGNHGWELIPAFFFDLSLSPTHLPFPMFHVLLIVLMLFIREENVMLSNSQVHKFVQHSAVLSLLMIALLSQAVQSADNDISLSQSYSPEKLQTILIPRDEWTPFPTPRSQEAWNRIPEEVRKTIIAQAEEYAAAEFPSLPATLYLEFRRNGDRDRFQAVYFSRRNMLHDLVLAECLEYQGRFLDAIANAVWSICEESSWTLPAHIGAQKAGSGLPDTTEPVVALFSAETASSLAWTLYLLEEELTNVSPQIPLRIRREIDQRILTPFLQREDFGWMGFTGRSDGRRPNNWNPWINSNVLTAALLVEKDEQRRAQLVHKVLRSLDNFVQPYPSDGSCDEGPSYWGHAGGSLFDNLDILHSATDGRYNYFDHPLIQEIGRFIYRASIVDDYFVNIGDCPARFSIYNDLVYRYGNAIDDENMMAFAASATPEEMRDQFHQIRYMGRKLAALFNLSGLLSQANARPPFLRDVWLGDEDMQMMIARDQEGSPDGLYVAAWGGHNGQSHNNNDVGNYIIFADGKPVIIDAGSPTYTRQTFSGQRYQIWVMQSAFHNLPTINGVMQDAGRRYEARDVRYDVDDSFAQLLMDIAPSYPDQAGVNSWKRSVRLNRGRDIQITDAFELKQPSADIVQTLLTPCRVNLENSGKVLFDAGEQTTVALQYNPEQIHAETETIPLEDGRLRRVWGETLYRVLLKAKSPQRQDTWNLKFSIAE